MTAYRSISRSQLFDQELLSSAPALFDCDDEDIAVYYIGIHIDATNSNASRADLDAIKERLEYGDISDGTFHASDGNSGFLVAYPGGDRLPGVGSYVSRVYAYRLMKPKEKKAEASKIKREGGKADGGGGTKPKVLLKG